ncbi:MAG TPA: 3-isopropylmalate dehydratase small subunit [Aliidongia sp.]|uniref:3-isopropylmalate dehydratase small subunit n=1 Tax=Aliidongia sp. TaxID=1914230 RepID=UPI002DDD353F|nr:3-isopropylmalate dehydratase small subunit [Aliidongia sp.]HEV2676418.1 3-isopropylmalate dehydratase small subunit [Aliidongia sp.]
MRPFKDLTAPACPLPIPNIDTDQLIPARFMRRPRSEGYGAFLFHDLRVEADGTKRDFPLNDPAHARCEVIVARRNFGCGSSREAAVYALADFGIRTVIAPSFGDIFASNAVKNGLLPAQVTEEDAERLLSAGAMVAERPVTVDLESQTIVAGNLVVPFTIDPVWKKQLLNGWDDIDLTFGQSVEIERFCAQDRQARPWAAPSVP